MNLELTTVHRRYCLLAGAFVCVTDEETAASSAENRLNRLFFLFFTVEASHEV